MWQARGWEAWLIEVESVAGDWVVRPEYMSETGAE